MANVQSQLNDLTQGGALAVKVLEQNKEQTGDTGRDVRFQSPLPTKKGSKQYGTMSVSIIYVLTLLFFFSTLV